MKRTILYLTIFLLSGCGEEPEVETPCNSKTWKYKIIYSNAWDRWWTSTDYYMINDSTNMIHYRDCSGDSIIASRTELEKIVVNY